MFELVENPHPGMAVIITGIGEENSKGFSEGWEGGSSAQRAKSLWDVVDMLEKFETTELTMATMKEFLVDRLDSQNIERPKGE